MSHNKLFFIALIACLFAGFSFGIITKKSDGSIQIYPENPGQSIVISANGNVGIATENPTEQLTVSGFVKATGFIGGTVSASTLAVGSGGIFGGSAGSIFVSSNGNVGIGMVAPNAKLDISGPVITGGPWTAEVLRFASSSYPGAFGSLLIDMSGASGGIGLGMLGSSSLYIAQSSGYVGIGTSVPQTVLEAVGAITIRNQGTGVGASGLLFSDPDNLGEYHSIYLNEGDNSLRIASYGGGWFDRVVFTTNGNVGIGTTAPSTKLDVAGTVSASALVVNGDIQTAGSNAFYFGDSATDGTWRIIRSANNLVFQRRESGAWVDKSMVLP